MAPAEGSARGDLIINTRKLGEQDSCLQGVQPAVHANPNDVVLDLARDLAADERVGALAVFGGIVSGGFYIAIFYGLIKLQEWARIMIIWLSYIGIVASLLILSPLEIATLVCAHWPSVRNAIKGASLAKTYGHLRLSHSHKMAELLQ